MSATWRIRSWPLFVLAVVATLPCRGAMAQEDFRSLDAGRPLKVTDAYPKKYLEWEFQFGLQGGWTEGGRDRPHAPESDLCDAELNGGAGNTGDGGPHDGAGLDARSDTASRRIVAATGPP